MPPFFWNAVFWAMFQYEKNRLISAALVIVTKFSFGMISTLARDCILLILDVMCGLVVAGVYKIDGAICLMMLTVSPRRISTGSSQRVSYIKTKRFKL